jgi:hypothetical protein
MTSLEDTLYEAHQITHDNMTAQQRALHDLYVKGLFWILREQSHGGLPPRDINKVRNWISVRMLAALTDHSVAQIAQEVIDMSLKLDNPEDMP